MHSCRWDRDSPAAKKQPEESIRLAYSRKLYDQDLDHMN